MVNILVFLFIILFWVVVLFKNLSKKEYGMLGYPATFAIIMILGSLFRLA